MSRRTEQVAEAIRRTISELLLTEVRDPRLGSVTVMDVHVSPDIRYARIHVGVLGDPEEQTATLATLRRATGFLRTELAQRMPIRHVPELRFQIDRSAEHAVHISKLLSEVLPEDEPEGERRD